MKKILFLLLCTVSMYGQTLQNPTFGNTTTNTIKVKANSTSTTALDVGVLETDGSLNKMTPTNLPIPQVPLNYSVLTPNIGGHLSGIDLKLGALSGTTAGISTRVWFTADQTTITAGTFDLTNATSKGTVASHQQTVANDDGQKKYFTTDLIGQPFAMVTTFPAGTYAGNLTASTTPTNANQKFTVELYRCNNAGTPIASGVAGAVTGSLGVTVIMIMDSGEVTLANASITNVPVYTNLGAGGFTINAGERIRYHVSAEKVGTAGGVINESVYYGSSYNSFIDVPVIYNSTSIKDVSTVTNGTGTVTDALNTLNTGKANLANPTFTGNLSLASNPLSSTPNKITQTMGNNDQWYIYGDASTANMGKMVFELGDDGIPIASFGESFEFRYNSFNSGIAKTPLIIDYDDITTPNNLLVGTTTANGNKFIVAGGTTEVDQFKYTRAINIGSTDIDLVTSAGFYKCFNAPNAPSADDCFLTVERHSGNDSYAHQVITPFVSGVMYSRSKVAGVWGAWRELATKAQLDAAVGGAKRYVALVAQTGTSAPTATVLENTLGGTIVWSRSSAGSYVGTLSGAFTINKTFVVAATTNNSTILSTGYLSANTIYINTIVSNTGVLTDSILGSASLEVRVYP